MLQSIRDHTQGWIAGVIISLLILSFALWGIHSYLVSSGNTSVVAKVNGVEITKSQFAVTYERLRRQLQIQYSSNYALPPDVESTLKQKALDTLINIQVLEQASLKQEYRISSNQIDNYLENMPEFQVNGQFSLPRFQQLLSSTLYSAGDFLDLIKTNLLIEQPRLGLLLTSFALPNETAEEIALVNQERDIAYVAFSLKDFLKVNTTIPEEKISAYYQSHQEDFKTPEQVSVEYLEISIKNLMNAIHPTDEMLKNFYNENVALYTIPIQWKLETIRVPVNENASNEDMQNALKKAEAIFTKLRQGEASAKIAAALSAVSDAKLQGWLNLHQIPDALQKTVLSFDKRGNVSLPVRMPDGYVIIRVVDVKEAKIQSFADVKDKVKEAYTRQQAEEKYADIKEKLANLTYEHPDSLQPAAQALGLTTKTSELFTKDKGGKDISAHTKIREAAFSSDVLNQNNSDVIQITPDSALVLRLKVHVPATLLSLNAVKKQILEKLTIAQADEKLAALVQSLQQKLQVGDLSAAQIANQYHVVWQQTGFIGRHANKIDSAILVTAFSMPKPLANTSAYSFVKTPSGYAIVVLKDVRDGQLKKSQEYVVFAEQMQNSQGLWEYELYKQGLFKKAKIVIENAQNASS